MQCSEFRHEAGADPQHRNADVLAHRAQCAACAAYLQQMLQLDALLKRAMEVPVSLDVSAPAPMPAPRAAARWVALAASVTVALVVGFGAWLGVPRETLAADIVAHVSEEAEIMIATDQPADADRLAKSLYRAGVRLKPGEQKVSVVRNCTFHGRVVPHLVVQTGAGPVTVMVLANEKVRRAQSFDEQGYRGTILPSGPGAIAIVAGSAAAVREASATFASAVEWTTAQ